MPGRPGLHPLWQGQRLGGGGEALKFCSVLCVCVCAPVCAHLCARVCLGPQQGGAACCHLLCLGSVVRALSSGWQAAQDSKPGLCRQKCQMVRIGGVPGLAAKGEKASVLWRAGLGGSCGLLWLLVLFCFYVGRCHAFCISQDSFPFKFPSAC